MPEGVRANRNYFRTRGGEAKMPEMWEQEALGCAGSRLRGDIQEELSIGCDAQAGSFADIED